MYSNQSLVMPKKKSLLGALAITVVAFLGSQVSAFVGYLVALFALIIMVVALSMTSIWPTKVKQENSIVFSLFWGTMVGGILPFLIKVYLEGGVKAVYELFTS
jgi:uncharacterized RDD family membrane protein YckC